MEHFVCPVLGCNKSIGLSWAELYQPRPVCDTHKQEYIPAAQKQQGNPTVPASYSPDMTDKANGVLSQIKQPVEDPPTDANTPPVPMATPKPPPTFAEILNSQATIAKPVQAQPKIVSLPSGCITYGSGTCTNCNGGGKHLPALSESQNTRAKAVELADKLKNRQQLKGDAYGGQAKGRMIGVLEYNGKFYATLSGQSIPQGFQRVCRNMSMTWVGQAAQESTAGGTPIDKSKLKQCGNSAFFECAGPILVSYVVSNVTGKPSAWSLTEAFSGDDMTGNRVHTTTYASCGNCQQILPQMLCLQ